MTPLQYAKNFVICCAIASVMTTVKLYWGFDACAWCFFLSMVFLYFFNHKHFKK